MFKPGFVLFCIACLVFLRMRVTYPLPSPNVLIAHFMYTY